MSSTPRPTTTPAPYGGFALSSVRRAGGAETPRFEAVLTRDGQPVAHVSNGGEGGAHRYQPLDAGGWAGGEAFNTFAAVWNAGSAYAGIEDGDQLVNRLLEVDRLSRMRSLPFVLDGDDPWTGDVWTLRGPCPEEVLEVLRGRAYAHRQPRAWSRATMDFVPVVARPDVDAGRCHTPGSHCQHDLDR